MVIKLTESNKTIARPLFKMLLCDNEKFENPIELNGLFDTGADISFIEKSLVNRYSFSFEKRVDTHEKAEQLLYVGFIKVPELSDNVEKIVFYKRAIHNSEIAQIPPDFLLGREFLKECVLIFDGPNLQLQVTKL